MKTPWPTKSGCESLANIAKCHDTENSSIDCETRNRVGFGIESIIGGLLARRSGGKKLNWCRNFHYLSAPKRVI